MVAVATLPGLESMDFVAVGRPNQRPTVTSVPQLSTTFLVRSRGCGPGRELRSSVRMFDAERNRRNLQSQFDRLGLCDCQAIPSFGQLTAVRLVRCQQTENIPPNPERNLLINSRRNHKLKSNVRFQPIRIHSEPTLTHPVN